MAKASFPILMVNYKYLANFATMTKKILLIYCGGTIGMTKDFESGSLKPFDFDSLLSHIPELQLLDCEIDTISFQNPKDSSDVYLQDWITLVHIISKNYEDYQGFVVLHGTDTMAYTASMISFMISGLTKPIIFTGSQLPIGDLRTDSKENLITSIHYATLEKNNRPAIREVCLYFEYKLYRANRTLKISSNHFDAYISPNYPLLGEAGVNLSLNENYLLQPEEEFKIETALNNKIRCFYFFPNCDYSILEHWIENPEVQAVILQTYGSGNIPTDVYLKQILKNATPNNTLIIVTTQCKSGGVEIGKYENSNIFKDIDAVNGKDMTLESALTKAMYLLGKELSGTEFKIEFERDYRGEIS